MAKASWIPLAIGGVGSVVLISGIQGESLAQVLKGEFGKFPSPGAKPKQTGNTGSPPTSNVSFEPGSPSISPPAESAGPSATKAPAPGAYLLRQQKEHELEAFLKRHLTAKEKMGFLLLEQKHEL